MGQGAKNGHGGVGTSHKGEPPAGKIGKRQLCASIRPDELHGLASRRGERYLQAVDEIVDEEYLDPAYPLIRIREVVVVDIVNFEIEDVLGIGRDEQGIFQAAGLSPYRCCRHEKNE